jgi:hypothetical protein
MGSTTKAPWVKTPAIEVTALGTELARRNPDNPYTTSNVGVIGKVEPSNDGCNACLRVGRVNPSGQSWSQSEFVCLIPAEREQLIEQLAATRRFEVTSAAGLASGRFGVLDRLKRQPVAEGRFPDDVRIWTGTQAEAEAKAAELNRTDPDADPADLPQPGRAGMFDHILRRNNGDKVQAGIEVARGLMRADPEVHKAGYEREAAVLAVTRLYELDEAEQAQVREVLPEEPGY